MGFAVFGFGILSGFLFGFFTIFFLVFGNWVIEFVILVKLRIIVVVRVVFC